MLKDFELKDLIPHWFFWLLALFIIIALNCIIVFGHKASFVVESNVACITSNIHKSGDSVELDVKCPTSHGDVSNTISSAGLLVAILKSQKDIVICNVYQNGKIDDCKIPQ